MAYWCSHAVQNEGDAQMYCDNVPEGKPPQPVDNDKHCKNCSVGMIRRFRDGWDDRDEY